MWYGIGCDACKTNLFCNVSIGLTIYAQLVAWDWFISILSVFFFWSERHMPIWTCSANKLECFFHQQWKWFRKETELNSNFHRMQFFYIQWACHFRHRIPKSIWIIARFWVDLIWSLFHACITQWTLYVFYVEPFSMKHAYISVRMKTTNEL